MDGDCGMPDGGFAAKTAVAVDSRPQRRHQHLRGLDKGADYLKQWPLVGIPPTAFETRNVGTTLELEPTASNDGQWISLNVVAQHVRLLRMAKIDVGVLA